MRIALNSFGKRVNIENASKREQYFCPACNKLLNIRQGTIREHCFAHRNGEGNCLDSWNNNSTNRSVYDLDSDWHREWQNRFPEDNQEIYLAFGNVKHRADILTGRNVIEFQKSPIKYDVFNKRTYFYHSCQCRVIWVFYLIDEIQNGHFYKRSEDSYLWCNARRTFDYLDIVSGVPDMFLQIRDNDENEKCLVKISKIEGESWNIYQIAGRYTKEEFLAYVGCENGIFPKPDIPFADPDPAYREFCKKYNVVLNAQQERAVQSVYGANLLLAVPGSGKTTTLITRIAYMVLCKEIAPSSILALAYTRKAALEMKIRLRKQFGDEFEKVNIRTINSLCDSVLKRAGSSFTIDPEYNKVLKACYKTVNKEWPSEAELMQLESEMAFVTNAMISEQEMDKYQWNTKGFAEIREQYKKTMRNGKKMDFDDQIRYAYNVLLKFPLILNDVQERCQYICVDEAQDVSILQHMVIGLLADKANNIFMVGDEDQSIYGFRGAYSQALLKFSRRYKNPYVLKSETNYRSYEEITSAAKKFADGNKNHIEKDIISARGPGGTVQVINVKDRQEQLEKLIELVRDTTRNAAILYRNNDSAVPVIDLLDRYHIPFTLNNHNNTLFSHRVVTDITEILRFALNPEDGKLLKSFYHKLNLYIKQDVIKYACAQAKTYRIKLLDALKEQAMRKGAKQEERAAWLIKAMNKMPAQNPYDAIGSILELGYSQYLTKEKMGLDTIDLLCLLATKEQTIQGYLNRLDFLKKEFATGNRSHIEQTNLTLSTIHSCKGMEFDVVYLIDVYDGLLPSSVASKEMDSVTRFNTYDEERRLFYVAVTRAKEEMYMFKQNDKKSEFIEEVVSILSSNGDK